MTLVQNTFEGGTNGTAITVANSGGASGDAFGAIISDGTAGSTLTFSAEAAMHGTRSAKFVMASGDTWALYYGAAAGTTTLAARMYVRPSALPSATSWMASVSNTGGTAVFRIYMNPTGTLRVDDASGAQKYVTTAALAVNTWYRVEWTVARGTTTTNGTITFAVYAGDSTTAVAGGSFSSAALNTGTTALDNVQFGRTSGSAATTTFYLDSVGANDGATAFIGPYMATNVAPTANAGADQANAEPWSTVTLTGTDSDTDGTIASRQWARTAGPAVTLTGATTATATFEAPATIAGTTLTFSYAATDNGGATTTDTMTVTVLPVTERAVIGGVEVPMRIRTT